MAITPVTAINSIADLEKLGQVSPSSSSSSVAIPFQSMFQDAVNNVKETDSTLQNEIYKLTTGQTDDLHSVTIASTKASLSVNLLVQLRNKALDAYNEVMKISV
ncbi:MAG TPA: flagellar hook-basal body complex protein FliE [Oscillospiraceae bacterium]|nr:flagellar hook-basal body complex protein FliE [Oscillospiraceae bacterium]